MEAISHLTILPQTPKEITSFVEACIDEITSGERNPLDFEIILKNVEDTIKKIRSDDRVKNCILNESNKYSEKIFNYHGYEFSKVLKPSFDFSNDQTWCDLDKKIKDRENFLKTIKPDMTNIFDEASGENICAPIVKYSEYLTKKYKG